MPSLDQALAGDEGSLDFDFSGAVEIVKAPAGTYVGEVTKIETDTSKNGNRVIKWFSKVVEPEDHEGELLPIYTTNMDGKGSGRTKAMIRALGFDTSTSDGRVKLSPKAVVGKRFKVEVAPQENAPQYLEFRTVSTV